MPNEVLHSRQPVTNPSCLGHNYCGMWHQSGSCRGDPLIYYSLSVGSACVSCWAGCVLIKAQTIWVFQGQCFSTVTADSFCWQSIALNLTIFMPKNIQTLIYFPQNFSLGRMLKPLKINLGHRTLKLPIETLTNCIILAPSLRMTH